MQRRYMSPPSNQIVCLTPVRNEAWILRKFLACASRWADQIILADNHSDDETPAIAAEFPKVRWLLNPATGYDEAARQRLLLAAGRKIPGPKVFVTLDADEFLSANYETSPEWRQIRTAPPGTLFLFDWMNVLPGFQRAWFAGRKPWALADDGSPHDQGTPFHSPRLSVPAGARPVRLQDIKVLHLQYVDWARMRSKHGWYECYECLLHPGKSQVELFREYHHMFPHARRPRLSQPLDPAWISGYERQGIAFREVLQTPYWWDRDVLRWIAEHGPARFAKAAIWHRDWAALRSQLAPGLSADCRDPRSLPRRWLHAYLHATCGFQDLRAVRGIDALLKFFGA